MKVVDPFPFGMRDFETNWLLKPSLLPQNVLRRDQGKRRWG